MKVTCELPNHEPSTPDRHGHRVVAQLRDDMALLGHALILTLSDAANGRWKTGVRGGHAFECVEHQTGKGSVDPE